MFKTISPIDRLREALECLAASPERQASELLRLGLGTCADELARVFDDAVRLVSWRRRPILPQSTLLLLEAIDQQLADMCDDPQEWTMTALFESIGWQKIRRSARRALAALSDSRPTLERPVAVH
jgi:hypothetical protein